MNLSYPPISAVIPTYNVAQYVGEAIESVLHQTHGPIEVIVVDDGSEDDTCRILGKFGDRVQLLTQKNAGPSAARNRGIRKARGEYIALLDADDLWLPEKTALQLECVKRYPDVGLVFCDMIEFQGNKREESTQFQSNGFDNTFFGHSELVLDPFRKLLKANFISTPSVLMSRSLFEQTGGFDEDLRFSEDLLLWLRIARISSIARVSMPLVLRRRHEGNITNSRHRFLAALPSVLQKVQQEHAEYMEREGISIREKLATAHMEFGKFLLALGEASKGRHEVIRGFMTYPSARRLGWVLSAFTRLGARWAKGSNV